jgi:hypothetical protein
MNQNRRTFIKVTSLASATLIPVVSTLLQSCGKNEEEISTILGGSFNKDLEFHVIDNNLLNLHFYFINVKKSGSSLVPASQDTKLKSFIIVRLPQMHVSEKGYWIDDWKKDERKYPYSALSGYSYLAFQLWPDKQSTDKKTKTSHPNKRLKFTLENVLNWNDENNFDLITLVEWFDLKGKNKYELDFRDYTQKPCDEFKNNKVWFKNTEEVNSEYEKDYYVKDENEPKHNFNYKKYKSLIKSFLDNNFEKPNSTNNQFIPITFLEVPQSLCLVPISGVRDEKGKLVKVPIKFWQNIFTNQEKTEFRYKKYEVWNNTLYYKNEIQSTDNSAEKKFKIETPSFRAIGIISDKFQCILPPDECLKECENQKETNYLPSLLDKAELTFLTQYAKENAAHDFTLQDFDIKEVNGLFFTGLGIITHLKYYNIEKCPVDKGIDLIEYEHIITQGRDIFIRVARLGYNSKTGQRYKHIIEGKRKIEKEIIYKDTSGNIIDRIQIEPTSFIELKQYCECIDKHIAYTDEEVKSPSWKGKFNLISNAPANSILTPINSNSTSTDFKRNLFQELTVAEKKRIPIRCLYKEDVQKNDVCVLQCLPWFWPTNEEATFEGQKKVDISYNDYLLCEYEAKDWSGKNIQAQTPFIFLRASYVNTNNIDEANSDYFSGDFFFKTKSEDKQIRDYNLIERRKTYFSNQKIAFTPSLKEKEIPLGATDAKLIAQIKEDNLNASKSTTNILETEFVEHYFSVKAKASFVDNNIVKTKYVVYPQVLRAKVFVDHIRDLAHDKIPSIVQYHEDYINHLFDDYTKPVDKVLGNGAKLILENTKAFRDEVEEPVNRTYKKIANALHEAKDRLGNLAVPDIIPESISLEKLGITAPNEIKKSIEQGKTVLGEVQNGIQKIASFNPRELLRGKLSDVCGLDLTAILDELIPAGSDNNQTPLFEINKTLNKIEGEILNSPIYKRIVEFKIKDPIQGDFLPPDQLIQRYTDKINELLNTFEAARLELNKKIKDLSNEIPNAEELDNLVKSLFEQFRTEAFNLIKKEELFIDINTLLTTAQASGKTLIEEAKDFYKLEINVIEDELDAKKKDAVNVIKSVVDELAIQEINVELNKPQFVPLKNKINEIITSETANIFLSIIKQYEDYLIRNKPGEVAFINFLNDRYSKILSTTKEISFPKVLGEDVYINVDTYELDKNNPSKSNVQIPLTLLNDRNSCGVIQLERKVEDFKTLIVKNINGSSFQKKVVDELQKTYIKPYETSLINSQTQLQNYSEQILGDIPKKVRLWEKDFDTIYGKAISDGLNTTVQDSASKIKTLILRLIPYVDDLRRLDPYYFYQEQGRLKKDVEDVERRFKKLVFAEYAKVMSEAHSAVAKYKDAQTAFSIAFEKFKQDPIAHLKEYTDAKNSLATIRRNQTDLINSFSNKIIEILKNTDEYKKADQIREEIKNQIKVFNGTKNDLEKYLQNQKSILQQQATDYAKQLDQKVKDYIDEQENKLIDVVGTDNILAIQANINEAKNIYRLLTSIRQQDLTYNWSTDKFRDINFGIVSFKKFSNPSTTLKVDVKATTYFTSGKFPPAIERVVTYSENRFTNFGISFFNSLTVNFNEISFIAGSDHSTHFDVKIKDVKFDGALSFVQAFESWLQTMGKGLILQLHGDHVALGYSLAIPAIKTPGFNIFNLSLNFDLRVFFDKRPLRFGFSLARPDSKFGIAVGIYAGFGFFGIVADPKKGIVEIDCALEAGAWAGISFGPFSGEVKLAFGFRYTKNEFGVRLEGYIVAEGRLSFWVIEVAARIYLGVVSQNSYVEGVCTVTYSVKIGFIKKSFSGSFRKKIAGASSNNSSAASKNIAELHEKLNTNSFLNYCNSLSSMSDISTKSEYARKEIFDKLMGNNEDEELVIEPVEEKEWIDFITKF